MAKESESQVTGKVVLGIDLGTTQSVVAWAPLDGSSGVELLAVPQLLAAATIGEQNALPSFLYLATADEASSMCGAKALRGLPGRLGRGKTAISKPAIWLIRPCTSG